MLLFRKKGNLTVQLKVYHHSMKSLMNKWKIRLHKEFHTIVSKFRLASFSRNATILRVRRVWSKKMVYKALNLETFQRRRERYEDIIVVSSVPLLWYYLSLNLMILVLDSSDESEPSWLGSLPFSFSSKI